MILDAAGCPAPQTAVLLAIDGTQRNLQVVDVARELVFLKRLWALNDAASEQNGCPVYCEVNEDTVRELRTQAQQAHAIAMRWHQQLEDLRTGKPAAASGRLN